MHSRLLLFTQNPLKSTILDARSGSASSTLLSSRGSLRAENKGGALGEVNPCVQPELGAEQDNVALLPPDVLQHLLCPITGRALGLGGTAVSQCHGWEGLALALLCFHSLFFKKTNSFLGFIGIETQRQSRISLTFGNFSKLIHDFHM